MASPSDPAASIRSTAASRASGVRPATATLAPRPGQRLGERGADPAAAARDEGDEVVESEDVGAGHRAPFAFDRLSTIPVLGATGTPHSLARASCIIASERSGPLNPTRYSSRIGANAS